MYLPSHFREERPRVMHELIRAHPLGALVTLGSQGLNGNHVPFEFDPEPAPHGTLRAHVARANPLLRDFAAEVEALVIFQGSQGYVTPSWYPTKRDSGRVVPTWNYLVVHAYGPLRVVDDRQWVRGLVTRLTDRHEAGLAEPWQVTDAPGDFIDRQLGAIVGIEIPVTRLAGKWKTSQNRRATDREGVARGLAGRDGPGDGEMARWVLAPHDPAGSKPG
ncbi:MAG: FMN-binding negative transcriptional regulator [Burkholderiales bacterium]|nr:FMN-binding negative transcriptional regulator [Burkholderiales bacterium]